MKVRVFEDVWGVESIKIRMGIHKNGFWECGGGKVPQKCRHPGFQGAEKSIFGTKMMPQGAELRAQLSRRGVQKSTIFRKSVIRKRKNCSRGSF